MRIWILICLSLCMGRQVAGAQDTRVQAFFAMKTGYCQTDISNFRSWATSQGVANAVGRADNAVIGFDIGINVNRVCFNIGGDFGWGSRQVTKPVTSLFVFGSGYQLLRTSRIDVSLLGQIGVGATRVRFRNYTPQSFFATPYNSSGAYARSIIWVGQPSIQIQFKPFANENESDQAGLMIYLRAGMDLPIWRGSWKYGKDYTYYSSSSNANTTVFRGTNVDMPNFYRGSVFLQLGVAFLMEMH